MWKKSWRCVAQSNNASHPPMWSRDLVNLSKAGSSLFTAVALSRASLSSLNWNVFLSQLPWQWWGFFQQWKSFSQPTLMVLTQWVWPTAANEDPPELFGEGDSCVCVSNGQATASVNLTFGNGVIMSYGRGWSGVGGSRASGRGRRV